MYKKITKTFFILIDFRPKLFLKISEKKLKKKKNQKKWKIYTYLREVGKHCSKLIKVEKVCNAFKIILYVGDERTPPTKPQP